MTLKRYDLGREYTGNTGSPAIIEQSGGAYVRHDDHQALADEWGAEKDQLEQIAMAQTVTITEARAEAAGLREALAYLRDCIESGREPGMGIVHRALRQQEHL